MEFSRQEYWSCLPFPSPGHLLDSGIKPASPPLGGKFFTTEPPGKPVHHLDNRISATCWLQKRKKSQGCDVSLSTYEESKEAHFFENSSKSLAKQVGFSELNPFPTLSHPQVKIPSAPPGPRLVYTSVRRSPRLPARSRLGNHLCSEERKHKISFEILGFVRFQAISSGQSVGYWLRIRCSLSPTAVCLLLNLDCRHDHRTGYPYVENFGMFSTFLLVSEK